MSTQKGNQKHLNLSDRINIEKGLNNNDSFATIAKVVQKDPTTISKEVRKHSKVKDVNGKYFSIKKGILFSRNAANYFP